MATTINSNTTDGIVITPDTSGEIELQANGVTKAKITANGLQDANGASLRGGMYRNLIINGDMSIAQRGTSATNKSTAGYYTCDRWKSSTSYGSLDLAQSTDVPSGQGFSNSFKIDCNTSATPTGSNEAYFQQGIEGQNVQHLKYGTSSAESITISFWVKSNKTGNYSVWLYQNDAARDAALPYTINAANTWEKKTLTFNGDTSGTINNDNGVGFEVRFYLGTGPDLQGTCDGVWNGTFTERYPSGGVNILDSTSNEWFVTGVQLEVGEGASDFEFLPYDVQLARCQRYFYKFQTAFAGGIGYKYGVAGVNYTHASGLFPVEMRATPSATSVGGSAANCSYPATNGDFVYHVGITARVNVSSSGAFRYANQILECNAEL